jgi:RNA-binding protein YhbY
VNVPIIGRVPNERAIKILEDTLEKLRRGELLNVAVVSEQTHDGQMLLSYDVSPTNGEAVKMRGALALLASAIDRKILGG